MALFFRSSGEVVFPLAAGRSPTNELLEFEIVLFIQFGSFSQPFNMVKIRYIGYVSMDISASFFIFSMSEYMCALRDLEFSITAGFCFPKGRLYKRRSSLGRFLHASLHYTKNTLLSQGVSPL